MAYDEATANAIAERIATGEPLEAICRTLPGAPTSRTIHSWINDNPAFASDIARARAVGHDAIAADCLTIADDSSRDYVQTEDGPRFDAEHVQRAKLRIETRLKLLSKWDKRYGDRTALELTGANGSDLFANLGKAELLAELSRRMSTPEIARALQSLQQAQPGALPALPGVATKVGKG